MPKPIDIDFNNVPEKIWWAMMNNRFCEPIPLREADLDRPNGWVYYRKYGVFYANTAQHALISSFILAWELGFVKYADVPSQLLQSIECTDRREPLDADYSVAQDYLIENYDGVALMSSKSEKIIVHDDSALDAVEYRLFRPFGFTYLF